MPPSHLKARSLLRLSGCASVSIFSLVVGLQCGGASRWLLSILRGLAAFHRPGSWATVGISTLALLLWRIQNSMARATVVLSTVPAVSISGCEIS